MINLQTNEEVLLLRRRHWLMLAFGIIKIILAMAVIGIALPLGTPYLEEVTGTTGSLMWFIGILVLQVLWTILFLIIVDYYLDAWIITNNRLVFVELHGIFSRTMSSIEFSRIQDISVEVHGILATFFKYGNIKIFTAGNEQGFVFEEVPQPYALKDELIAIRDQLRNEEAHRGAEI